MNAVRFSPIMGMLLLLLIGVALALSFSANSPKTNLGQVPTSVATILPTIPVTIPVPTPVSTVVTATYEVIPTEVIPTMGPEERQTREALFGPQLPYTPAQATAISAEAEMYQSLHTRVGTIVAQGTNTTPTGPLHLKTYRLEEVLLPAPFTFTRHVTGRDVTVDRVWRLTVTGGPFEVRGASVSVYVDRTYVGVGGQSSNLDAVTAFVFDGSVLSEGATISVSYSTGEAHTELPERLHFNP